MAWEEFIQDFVYNGSKELRIGFLEEHDSRRYTIGEPMVKFIDDFQSYIAEIEAIAPGDYTDDRKKRLLLSNIQPAPEI